MSHVTRAFAFVAAWACCGFIVQPCSAQLYPITAVGERRPSAERALRDALALRISCDIHDMALVDVADYFSRVSGVDLQLDQLALRNASMEPEVPVSVRVVNSSIETALELALQPLELTWVFRGDVLLITTQTTASSLLEIRVYPVRDLVVREHQTYLSEDYQSIIDVLTSSIHPTTWTDVGGQGSVKEFRNAGALVIDQTREVRDQIELLLANLRKVRDAQGIKPVYPDSPIRSQPQSYPSQSTGGNYFQVAAPPPTWRLSRVHD